RGDDAQDRLTRAADRDGRLSIYGYDALGRLVRQDGLAFAGAGNAGPSPAEQQRYAFDAAGRLTSAADAEGAYAFSYDALGRRLSSVDPNGLSLTFSYDAADRRTGRTELSNGQAVSVLASSYDDDGQLTSRSLTASG